jgi:hypothetical protein
VSEVAVSPSTFYGRNCGLERCASHLGTTSLRNASMFCPENEATMALMRLESNRYYQGKWNMETYIDKFKDLVDLYTDPIAIVLKFHRRLNSTIQNRIAESGMDRPGDTDFNGWFKAAVRATLLT